MKYTDNPLITRTCPECGDRLQHANNMYGDQIVLSALYCTKHPLIDFAKYKVEDNVEEEKNDIKRQIRELDQLKKELLEELKELGGGDN